jgi:hypothetical protein
VPPLLVAFDLNPDRQVLTLVLYASVLPNSRYRRPGGHAARTLPSWLLNIRRHSSLRVAVLTPLSSLLVTKKSYLKLIFLVAYGYARNYIQFQPGSNSANLNIGIHRHHYRTD